MFVRIYRNIQRAVLMVTKRFEEENSLIGIILLLGQRFPSLRCSSEPHFYSKVTRLCSGQPCPGWMSTRRQCCTRTGAHCTAPGLVPFSVGAEVSCCSLFCELVAAPGFLERQPLSRQRGHSLSCGNLLSAAWRAGRLQGVWLVLRGASRERARLWGCCLRSSFCSPLPAIAPA